VGKLDDRNLEGRAQQLENVLRTSTDSAQAQEKIHEMLLYDAGHLSAADFNQVKERWREMNQEDIGRAGRFDKQNGYKLPEVELGAAWDSNRITLDGNRGGLRLQQEGENVLTSQEYDREHALAGMHNGESHSYARLSVEDPAADVPTYPQNADGSQDLGLEIPPLPSGSVIGGVRPHVQPAGGTGERQGDRQQYVQVSYPDGSRWEALPVKPSSQQEFDQLNEQAVLNAGRTMLQDARGNWYYPVRPRR